MKQNDQFKELAKKAYLNYHEDGVLDLIMGASCLGIAAFFGTGNIVFNMFSWMPILFFMPLKNRITFPRIGYVKFDTRRGRPAKLILLMTVTIVLGLFVLGTVFFLNTGRVDPRCPQLDRRTPDPDPGVNICRDPDNGSLHHQHTPAVTPTQAWRLLSSLPVLCCGCPNLPVFLALGGVVFISGVVRVVRFLRKISDPH